MYWLYHINFSLLDLISLVSNHFLISLLIFSLTGYLRVCCLTSTCLNISQFFFCYSKFHSIVFGKHTLHDLNSFKYIMACFIVYNMVDAEKYSIYAKEECIFHCCWVEWSIVVFQMSWIYVMFTLFIFLLIFCYPPIHIHRFKSPSNVTCLQPENLWVLFPRKVCWQ